MDNRNIIRTAGIAGIIGTILMFAGDMIMYGGNYSGSEYMEASRRIMSEIPLLRLMAGGAIGPAASVLYCLGFYHVFAAIRQGSLFLSKIFLS
ncbi:hypothetical protein J7K93_04490, partial [bacterium]|nr:hypothetical protein [bacterium]